MLMYRRKDNLGVIGHSDTGFVGYVDYKNQRLIIFSSYLMELYLGGVRSRP